jgi:DNA-binding GntR family transcriptional regulator
MDQPPNPPGAGLQMPAPLTGVVVTPDDLRTAEGVYRELLNRLVNRTIAPGARISIDGTSRELGVSQTPIREALVRLESDRLVTRVHMSGFRAAPLLTRDEFEKLFEMRLLIEPYLTELAASRHADDQAERMASLAERMRSLGKSIGRTTYGEFASEDAWLHDLIAEAADSPPLRSALLHLHAHVHVFRLLYDTRVPLDALDEHDDVLSAIVERRPTAASGAMREHLRASRARLSRAFEA